MARRKSREARAGTSPEPAQPKGKGRLKREATEAQIVDAFHRVVQREGLRNVRVNAIIKEAGCGKGLLYDYFGGLPGLVQAWGNKYQIWPDIGEMMGLSHDLTRTTPAEQIRAIVFRHAEALRGDPLRIELLADEFMSPTAISPALSDVRKQLAQQHHALFARQSAMTDDDNRSLILILMAAASYLAMRAERAPRFLGTHVGSKEGWADLMRRFERIIDLVQAGTQVRDQPPAARSGASRP
jgi:AcrR family transcriptional regulator